MSGEKVFEVAMRQWFQGVATSSVVTTWLPLAGQAAILVQNEMIRRDVGRLQERQLRGEEALASLSDVVRAQEESTSRTLAEHDERLEALRSATAEDIAALAGGTRAALEQERAARRRDVERVEDALTGVIEERDRSREAAERWLADARTMREAVATTLPHERYRPGRLAELDRRLATAAGNLAAGSVESALAVAQLAYHDLSDLRVDLELEHREWLSRRWQAVHELTVLSELVTHTRRLPVDAVAGGDLTISAEAPGGIDVDHWSDGDLEKLSGEVEALLAEARQDDGSLTAADLREIVEVRAPHLRARVEEIVTQAWTHLQASQVRANIADLFAEALEQGFAYQAVEDHYEDGDNRRAFTARLTQPLSRNEVVLVVSSVGEDDDRAQVRVQSVDHDDESERQRRQRAEAITRYLRGRGLPVSDPVESQAVPPVTPETGPVPVPEPEPVPRPAAQPQPQEAATGSEATGLSSVAERGPGQ